jgi:hypothetical protein
MPVTIINVRGNHASGKSTAVRNVLANFHSTPIYGVLGPRFPEAYRCETWDAPFYRKGPPLYILGSYEKQAGTVGFDLITKRGVDTIVALLRKYAAMGDVLYESIMTSVRFSAPTIGAWMMERKDDIWVVVLDVTLEECLASLHGRQETSGVVGGEKHIRANQRQFERVQTQLKDLGFRMVYVKRESAVETILGLLK